LMLGFVFSGDGVLRRVRGGKRAARNEKEDHETKMAFVSN
jgi:hypothetical protein